MYAWPLELVKENGMGTPFNGVLGVSLATEKVGLLD